MCGILFFFLLIVVFFAWSFLFFCVSLELANRYKRDTISRQRAHKWEINDIVGRQCRIRSQQVERTGVLFKCMCTDIRAIDLGLGSFDCGSALKSRRKTRLSFQRYLYPGTAVARWVHFSRGSINYSSVFFRGVPVIISNTPFAVPCSYSAVQVIRVVWCHCILWIIHTYPIMRVA